MSGSQPSMVRRQEILWTPPLRPVNHSSAEVIVSGGDTVLFLDPCEFIVNAGQGVLNVTEEASEVHSSEHVYMMLVSKSFIDRAQFYDQAGLIANLTSAWNRHPNGLRAVFHKIGRDWEQANANEVISAGEQNRDVFFPFTGETHRFLTMPGLEYWAWGVDSIFVSSTTSVRQLKLIRIRMRSNNIFQLQCTSV